MTSKLLTDDILKKFHTEVMNHVKESEQLVEALGKNGRDAGALEQLGRHLHTVKGSAPIMGAKPISLVAREMEECIKAVGASPLGVRGPFLERFSELLRVIRRQIDQFARKEEMESGADAIAALRSLMPAGRLLDVVLKHLEVNTPELLKTLEETHRHKLKDSLNSDHRVYSICLSLPTASYQKKLVEALKMIGTTGTAVTYAMSSKKPREGFDQLMVLLVVSELPHPEFVRRLETLPVDIVEIGTQSSDPGRALEEDDSLVSQEAPGRSPAGDPGHKKRVLLVEDSDATRELYRMVLLANGFEVMTAKDGSEALQHLRSESFHGVLSDDQMPVMDGLELLGAIKSDASLKHLPVIIMSGKGTDEDRSKALATGAARYFVKGAFEKSTLVAALREVTQ